MSDNKETEKKVVVKCDICGNFILVNKREYKTFMQVTCPKCGEKGRLFPREMVK